MSVFKDDQVVAKVLGKVHPPRYQTATLLLLCFFGLAIVGLASYAVIAHRAGAVTSASATRATLGEVSSPTGAGEKVETRKHLPPVIEEVSAEVVDLHSAYSVKLLDRTPEPARDKSKPAPGSVSALLEEAKKIEDTAGEDAAQLEKARAMYQRALESNQLQNPQDTQCLVRLNELTAKMILDPKFPCLEPKPIFHKVEPGDAAERVARKFKINQGQLKRINRLGEKLNVRLGQNLKMLPGEVTYKVDRQNLTGTLYIDGVYIRRYPVGIGPGTATPAGTFVIENKVMKPDWYYDGKKVPYGDPKNILGSRWMGFANTGSASTAGLGVHGTAYPESVPGRESKGCVRMHNDDVEELYDFMPQGGKVIIE